MEAAIDLNAVPEEYLIDPGYDERLQVCALKTLLLEQRLTKHMPARHICGARKSVACCESACSPVQQGMGFI
jgi:hypothetical protein